MTLERILLQTIKFDLQVEHPYHFLLKYAKCLKGDKTKLQKMVQMAWTFVNDSLCTTLCLQWEPEVIAVALMYLAGKLSKFEVVDWTGRQPKHLRWWDMFIEDVTMDLLEDICHQVLDLYSQPQPPADAPDSPPLAPSRQPQQAIPTTLQLKDAMTIERSPNSLPPVNLAPVHNLKVLTKGGSNGEIPKMVLDPTKPPHAHPAVPPPPMEGSYPPPYAPYGAPPANHYPPAYPPAFPPVRPPYYPNP
ncbi:hypothetical protein O3M35_000445 [Rhynocoris fuscipes]|uniref:Cyclin C-terminal domain-containing protein n=1 Tax=Rhynocoris fuscipes TaxID=488301 RepID=A0AAW1DRV9_9HEMI